MKMSFTTNGRNKRVKSRRGDGNKTEFNIVHFLIWKKLQHAHINRNYISNMEMLDDAREKKRIIIRAQTLERKKEI